VTRQKVAKNRLFFGKITKKSFATLLKKCHKKVKVVVHIHLCSGSECSLSLPQQNYKTALALAFFMRTLRRKKTT
jgi:hypothetical protein